MNMSPIVTRPTDLLPSVVVGRDMVVRHDLQRQLVCGTRDHNLSIIESFSRCLSRGDTPVKSVER